MGKIIDTDMLWKEMQKLYTNGDVADEDGYNLGINCGITKVRNLFSHIPSAERHGTWEYRYVEDGGMFCKQRFYCSECGEWQTYGKTAYCPCCGAKMGDSDE